MQPTASNATAQASQVISSDSDKLAAEIFARNISSDLGQIMSDAKLENRAKVAIRAAERFYAELHNSKNR